MHSVSRIIKIPCATFNIFRCFTKMKSSDAGHLESVDFSNEAADRVVRLTIDTIVYMKPKVTSVSPRHLRADTSCLT